MLVHRIIQKAKILILTLLLGASALVVVPSVAYAASTCPAVGGTPTCCGKGSNAYQPSISLGCSGQGDPIMDLLFAAIRFLSYGAGLIIVGSLTYAGIQYTGSRGDPNAHALAVKRIQANVVALLMFVFAFAIVNYVVPGQILK